MKLYCKHKFDAAHFLRNYGGKCKNLHGHTWVVEIWIEKKLEPGKDMLIDFVELKKMIDELDHQNLNDYMYNPTAENVVGRFLDRLKEYNATVKVWESENSYIEGNTDEDL